MKNSTGDTRRQTNSNATQHICLVRKAVKVPILFLMLCLLQKGFVLSYQLHIPLAWKWRFSKSDGWPRIQLSSRLRMSKHQRDDDGEDEKQDDEQRRERLTKSELTSLEKRLTDRVARLEEMVAWQEVEIHRLKKVCDKMSETSEAFVRIIEILRDNPETEPSNITIEKTPDENDETTDESTGESETTKTRSKYNTPGGVLESYEDSLIFGTAPSSVIDAADAAGAAILAAMLGGKQRMLVDVRDADLSSDPEVLVEFIELAILPIAAGLQGLKSTRNRVKVVFPTVSQLLEYRKTMALAAPEVITLSTLGFDPVEKRDKLVVIVAPAPDDEEGLKAMNELLEPTRPRQQPIQQPVVILNHHMAPVGGLSLNFETAYHLRLLTVQYMSDGDAQKRVEQFRKDSEPKMEPKDDYPPLEVVGGTAETAANDDDKEDGSSGDSTDEQGQEVVGQAEDNQNNDEEDNDDDDDDDDDEIVDGELLAAMKHAQGVASNSGITRAMVIRAYPRPWHVFVDTSPDTDSDFQVAATFDVEPTLDEINLSIVECLEGSEREDEIVAQQMQQALEEGQLDKVSDMIGEALERYNEDKDDPESSEDGEGQDSEEDSRTQ